MNRMIAGAALLVSGTMMAHSAELGGNYNQYLYDIDNSLIAKSGITWVRGFINIPRNFLVVDSSGRVTGVLDSNISQEPDSDSDDTDILAISAVSKLIDAKSVMVGGHPVKVILSLKLDFKYMKMGVPEAGSPAMDYLISAVEKCLVKNNLGASIDILVVGNEPMWETPDGDADKYEAFLNLLIDKLDGLRAANAGWKYEIFTGALNRASELKNNAILRKIVKITEENSKVAGVDLHLHVGAISAAEDDVSFARQTFGKDKKIISTEFSLVHLWDNHRNDALADWGAANGYPADMKMYEWINLLERTGIPRVGSRPSSRCSRNMTSTP